MNASQILKTTKPGDLFSNDLIKCKNEYKTLVKEWHPDTNSSSIAKDVFQKINELYNQAIKMIEDDKWEKSNYISFKAEDGKTLCINYQYTYQFELGEAYICAKHVVYIFNSDKEKYYRNAIKRLEGITYADSHMEKLFSNLIPQIISKKKLVDGRYCLVLFKTEDVIPLRLVVDNYFKKKVPAVHVAWMCSRLHNLECFLQYNQIAFNGINIDNCFISPEYHTVMLYGGWWYAVPIGEKMIGTTGEIYKLMPIKNKTDKVSNTDTDLESIKLIARELFGSPTNREALRNKEIPSAIAQFITDGAGTNAYEEFHKWDNALTKSYGARKFIKLDIKNEDIYH